ncbi:MAG: serine/threonine protein kinase [Sandaracinaceae bacterium]|nr:serine/threonine protein kinase [Sandaracinaceae bacterium]
MTETDPEVVAGRYRLEAKLGEGGMAEVWRARDLALQRAVALKRLTTRLDTESAAASIARFRREAALVASVRHPNVVEVLDFGTDEGERPFIVLELLEGEPLERRLGRAPALGLDEVIAIAAQILDGLEAVHAAGIVHRDLKPANVFLVPHEAGVRAKLLDFGVSRATADAGGRRSVLTTTQGRVIGTPEYMSPEQARGWSDVDARADLYSVGAILYEILTGTLPYDAEGFGDLIVAIALGGAPRVCALRPELGEPLSDVIARAMAVDRAERFPSAAAMRDALRAAVSGADAGTLPATPPRRLLLEASPASSSGSGPLSSFLTLPRTPAVPPVPSMPAPPRRARRWRAAAALFALAAVAGALAAYLLTASPSAEAPATAAARRAPAAATPLDEARAGSQAGVRDPDARRPHAPARIEGGPRESATASSRASSPAGARPSEAETIEITLVALPRDAVVRVDGERAQVRQGRLELPRDGAAHTLRVDWPGGRFTRRIDADRDTLLRIPARARRTTPGIFRELD